MGEYKERKGLTERYKEIIGQIGKMQKEIDKKRNGNKERKRARH